MDKASKQIIQGLMNELAIERQLADQLAEALIEGGMDRQFAALTFHEITRNGFMYPGIKVGDSPESKPKKRKRSGHPSTRQNPPIRWQRPDKDDKDYWTGFDQ